jgi:hypothetical protein
LLACRRDNKQNDLRQEISEMNQMIEGYLAFVRG